MLNLELITCNVNKINGTLTFEHGEEIKTLPFEEYDEWGSVGFYDKEAKAVETIDYHLLENDGDPLGLWVYRLKNGNDGYAYIEDSSEQKLQLMEV